MEARRAHNSEVAGSSPAPATKPPVEADLWYDSMQEKFTHVFHNGSWMPIDYSGSSPVSTTKLRLPIVKSRHVTFSGVLVHPPRTPIEGELLYDPIRHRVTHVFDGASWLPVDISVNAMVSIYAAQQSRSVGGR